MQQFYEKSVSCIDLFCMQKYCLRRFVFLFWGIMSIGCTKEIPEGLLGQWHWEGYIYTVSSGSYQTGAPFEAEGVLVFEPNNLVHSSSNLCLLFPMGEPTGGTYFLDDSTMVVSCRNGQLQPDTLYFSISNQKLIIRQQRVTDNAAVYARQIR